MRSGTDPTVVISVVVGLDGFVQFGDAVDLGHGHKVVTAEPPDVAFDAAFLVGTADTGLAVERVNVMGPKGDPAVGFDALPGEPDHLGYGCFQVVLPSLCPQAHHRAR